MAIDSDEFLHQKDSQYDVLGVIPENSRLFSGH